MDTRISTVAWGAIGACLMACWVQSAWADAGVMPKTLIDPGAPEAPKQLAVSTGAEAQISAVPDATGIVLTMKKGDAPWPGITVSPADGKPWDLSNYGHVEAKITNTGATNVTLNLRIDNASVPGENRWNAEMKKLAPGESAVIRVWFGYSYNAQRGYALDTSAVVRLLFFCGKLDADASFRIEDIKASGFQGEQPGVSADEARIKPKGGVILGGAKLALTVASQGGGYGGIFNEGAAIRAGFKGAAADAAVRIKPTAGFWDLGDHMRVVAKIRNIGPTAVSPRLRLDSIDGPTDSVALAQPLAPGADAAVILPFAAATPWEALVQEDQILVGEGRAWSQKPGTGNVFRSHKVRDLTVLPDPQGGDQLLEFLSIVADQAPAQLPAWLGQRPPVDGDWSPTLKEEFDGDRLNDKIWNVYWFNWWDKRQHYSQDSTFVRDGHLILRTEKKLGHHNDDPKEPETPYATGWADTFGKWTQRYGYFEVRCKLPSAPHLWPGIWMMPDRGLKESPGGLPGTNWAGFKKRYTTSYGGMEFDLVESQSMWGPHRFNVACHWGNDDKGHHRLGTSSNYVETDADGYIVVGMLWLPGKLAFYGNGKEFWRWESPRISSVQMQFHLQNMLGGWETDPLDDAQLPADLLIDYIRVWQRADLATPEDGPKPNKGGLDGRLVDGTTD